MLTLGKTCFSQNINSDDEIKNRYAVNVPGREFNKQRPAILLIKIKPESSVIFKKQYRDKILRQFTETWFVIKNTEPLLTELKLFQAIFPANNLYKLSDVFFTNRLHADSGYLFIVSVLNKELFLNDIHTYQLRVQSSYNMYYTFRARLSFMTDTLINRDYLIAADIILRQPKEETIINDYDNSVNAINLFFSKYNSINGNGLTASVKENLFDTTDIDFKERHISSPISSDTVTSHASTMATLIAGGGNSFQTSKGIAWASLLSSSDFSNLLPDDKNYFDQYHITVQNNSYGVGVENFYGADAEAYDQSTIENPYLLYVFSAGNSGDLASTDGRYKNLTGFANLTGSFKQAKNIITAGSIDSFYNVAALSSKGPAYDGRVKPEVVAYGNDGSSGAAAITSGAVLAVQSAYASVHADSLPQNALVKAIILNSADDVFNEGPDFYSGYGNVNVYNAVKDVLSKQYFPGSVQQDEVENFPVHIPADISNLKITLVWNDPAAQPNAFTALMNDIDLTLERLQDHTVWLPWVLNSNPDSSTLLLEATRKRDSLNNVEQITLSNPAEGDYVIHVKGYNMTTSSQTFYIAYRFDTTKNFVFISPVSNTHFPSGSNSIFRWQTSIISNNAKLEYSINNGNTWNIIDNTVNLSKKYFKWIAPDTNAIAIARMTIDHKTFYSDTFDISKQIFQQVGFVCNDSALIYWGKQKDVHRYRLFTLSDKYLQPQIDIEDTFYVFRNAGSSFVAVAPLLNDHVGINSYTVNFFTQGVGCYISNFLADPDGENASLKLYLGTTFNIKNIQFQNFVSGVWKTIAQVQPVNNIFINYATPLRQGVNDYRAVVTLENGSNIISNDAVVYFLGTQDYIIAPNPVNRGSGFYVLSKNISANTIMLFDITGRKLLQEKISQQQQSISTTKFAEGVYIIVIADDDNHFVYKTKILVH